jgi:hypothetical protein
MKSAEFGTRMDVYDLGRRDLSSKAGLLLPLMAVRSSGNGLFVSISSRGGTC